MKRNITILNLLILVLVISLTAGCQPKQEKKSDTTDTTTASDKDNAASSSETSDDSSKSNSLDPSGKEVEISFWHHMEGLNAEALEQVVDNFNQTIGKERGIKVTPSFQGTNTGDKLNTLAQAGDFKNFPDAVQVASAAIPNVSNYENNVTVEEMYEAGEEILLDRKSIIPNNARTFTYLGKQVGMPLSNSTILLYYNKDAFKDAGLDPENPPKTIAELADATAALKTEDRVGLTVLVQRYQLVNWIGSQGEFNFIGDNEGGRAGMMTKFTFGEDGSLMNFLNEWEKVIASGGYKPIEDNINEEFAMGSTAMAIMSSGRIGKVSLLAPDFEWGTAALPLVNAEDKGGMSVGGSGTVMFSHGDEYRKLATWIFTQYLSSVDAQLHFCKISGYLPMNYEVYETDDWKQFEAENDKIVAPVQQLMNSNPNVQEPFDLVTYQVYLLVGEEMTKFAQGEQTKQETHDNIVNRCNAELAEYVKVNQ